MPKRRGAQDGGAERTGQIYKLKLKPPEDSNYAPKLEILESEYGSRYLEGLGVAPSRSTLDLVNKNVPLSQKYVNTTLRAKGHVNDEIQITVPPLTHQPKVPQVINPHAVLQLGLNTQEAGALGAENAEDAAAAAEAAAGRLPEPKHVPGSKFRLLAAKFLHPFNLDVSSARKQLAAVLHGIGRESRGQGATGATTSSPGEHRPLTRPTKSMQRSTSVSMLKKSSMIKQLEQMQEEEGSPGREEVLQIQMTEELLQELLITHEVVLVLQTQIEGALLEWHTHTAAETLRGRLSDEEFKATLELLVSDDSIRFFITLLNFMHEEFVHNSPSYPHQLALKLQRESNTGDNSPKHLSKAQSRRTSFVNGAPGGKEMKPNKQLVAFAEHDLGWQVWSAERDFVCKQEEAEEERKAAEFEAKKFSSMAGSLFSTSASKRPLVPTGSHSRTVVQATKPPSPPHPLSHRPPSPQLTHPLPHALHPVAPKQPVVTTQVARRTHPKTQFLQQPRSSPSRGGRPPSVFHGPRGPQRSELLRTPDGDQDESDDEQPASPQHSTPDTGESGRPDVRHKRTKPASMLGPLDSQDLYELQQARLFVLQREFNALYKSQRSTRAGMFFTLPVFLVAARLLVHLLFSSLYRLWVMSDEGAAALELMDETIVFLFDPSGYLQKNLTILESTPAAVSIMAKHPQLGHGPERVHLSDVSPLMRAAMQQPASHETRKLLVDGAKHKPSRHATNTNRVVNAAGAAAIAGADVPSGHSFQQGLRQYQQHLEQQQQQQQQRRRPFRTQLNLEQTDALFREALAGVLQDGPQVGVSAGAAALAKRRERVVIPSLKKK